MMRGFTILVLTVLFGFSCSQKVVNYTNDASAFKSYESFVIVNLKKNESEEISAEGSAIMGMIKTNIQYEMDRRSYYPASIEPDLIVRYEFITNQRTEVDVPQGSFYGYNPNQFYRQRTFLESALLIEITDAKTRKMVWQASMDLNKYNKKDKNQEILQKAVTQIFNTYLYKAGSNIPDQSLIVE